MPIRTFTRVAAAVATAIALAIPAYANLIQVVEEVTTTHTITIVTTELDDSAEVEITGPGFTGSNIVMDGNPSVAEVTAPRSPSGSPFAMGKAFGDGESGETWTAYLAVANGSDTYNATLLDASASKTVIVENLTNTTRTVTVRVIFVPEMATVAFDDGVNGEVELGYTIALDDGTVLFEVTFVFDGTEVGSPSVLKDGILWTALDGTGVRNLGVFDNGFVMDSTPIELPFDLVLDPNETREIEVELESRIETPSPEDTSGEGRLGATSNTFSGDAFEPNNAAQQASGIFCDQRIFQVDLIPGDVDFYQLAAEPGTIVEIALESTAEVTLDVLDLDENPIARLDFTGGAEQQLRFVSTGADLLRFESNFDPIYAFTPWCLNPNPPLIPGDLLGATPEPVPELFAIDPVTGTARFQLPLSGLFGEVRDLVIDPFTGLLLGIVPSANVVVDIDPNTGQQFPICDFQLFGDINHVVFGPDGLLVTWNDPLNGLFLGTLDLNPTPEGVCPIVPNFQLPFVDIGGLAFDPLSGLLFGCTGPQDPQQQIFVLDPLGGQNLPPIIPPAPCGGLELFTQAVLGQNRGGGPALALVTPPDVPSPGTLYRVDLTTGTSTPIGDTGTGGLIALTVVPGDRPDDSDGDGLVDPLDNCIDAANPEQLDGDGDGIGNLCDQDLNQDCSVNAIDLGLMRVAFFTTDPVADFDGNGIVNAGDLGLLRAAFFGTPGPSGLPNLCGP